MIINIIVVRQCKYETESQYPTNFRSIKIEHVGNIP